MKKIVYRIIKQGDIYLANLDPVYGHEQGGWRPVIILQNNTFNLYLNTVLVAPFTTNLQAKGRATTYFLPKDKSGLQKDSVILLFQTRTIDKTRLGKQVGHLDQDDFRELRVKLIRIFY